MTPYYDEDGVTIWHGDALDVLDRLPRSSVDACVTDPPYVIGAVSAGSLGSKAGGWADMMNSALWFTSWYRQVDRLLGPSGSIWTFCNWRSVPVVMRAALDAGLPVTSLAVWDKEWIGPGGPNGLRPSYEMVALLAKGDYGVPDRGARDVIRCKVGPQKEHGHPAQKPVDVVRAVMTLAGLPAGSAVLDPFVGSGTTAIAARQLGYRCVAIEAEERWCEVAAKRLAQGVLDFGEEAS